MTTRRGTLAVLLALPAVALVALALPVLLGTPLWRDESATWAFSTLGYGDLVRATGHVDRVFLPYYSLVHTLRLVGLDETGCRAVSLLAAVGTVTLVQLLGRVWSATAGFLAAMTLVMNPMFVVSATTMRPYALATACTAVATWLVVRRPQHLPLRVRWWLYLAAVLAAVQLHLFSATLAVPHVVWLWLRVRRRVLPVVGAWVVALAASTPLAVLASGQNAQVGWIESPTWDSIARQTATATGSDVRGLGALTAAVVVGCALLGVGTWVRRGRPDPTWLVALLLWLWPVAALTVVSLLAAPVALWRYFMSSAIGAALLVGYGATVVRGLLWRGRARALGNRTIVVGLVTAALLCLLPALRFGRPAPDTVEGHPAIDAWLARTVRPGDVVAYRQGVPETGFAYGFADELDDSAFQRDAVQALVDGQPPFFVREVLTTGPSTMTTRASDGRGARTVWVVGLTDRHDHERLGDGTCRPTGERHEDQQTLVVRLVCQAS